MTDSNSIFIPPHRLSCSPGRAPGWPNPPRRAIAGIALAALSFIGTAAAAPGSPTSPLTGQSIHRSEPGDGAHRYAGPRCGRIDALDDQGRVAAHVRGDPTDEHLDQLRSALRALRSPSNDAGSTGLTR